MPGVDISRMQNAVLRRLPEDEWAELAPYVAQVHVSRARSLQEIEVRADSVYFPVSGMASLVVMLADGNEVEVGSVGKEGVLNGDCLVRSLPSPVRIFGQVPGEVLQLSLAAFRSQALPFAGLRRDCASHSSYMYAVAVQLAACNRRHEVTNRLARWLLQVHDHIGLTSFPMTQEFMSDVLGVRRPTITVSVHELHTAGLASSTRGMVHIHDLSGLAKRACECHDILRRRRLHLYEDD